MLSIAEENQLIEDRLLGITRAGPEPDEEEDRVRRLKDMIQRAEGTGGNYSARGASEEEGLYQFQPDTWRSWAGRHLGNPEAPKTSGNQEAVMSAQLQEWINKGYTDDQILRLHNSGQPDRPLRGVNKYGVPYDTEKYIANAKGEKPAGGGNEPERPAEIPNIAAENMMLERRILGRGTGEDLAAFGDITRRFDEESRVAVPEPVAQPAAPKGKLSGGLWSFAKSAGLGFARGVTTGIPGLGGSMIEFFGDVTGDEAAEALGKGISDWAEKKGDEWYGKAPEETLDWIAYKGMEMFGPSAIPGGIAKLGIRALMGIGGLVRDARVAEEAVVALKAAGKMEEAAARAKEGAALLAKAKTAAKTANRIGDISVASAFGMQQYESTKDLALKAADQLEKDGKLVEAEIMRSKARGVAPALTGIIEAIGEYFGSKYLGKMLGLDEAAVAGRNGKQKVMDFLKTLVMENVTEIGQAGGEAAVEKYTDIRPTADILRESLSVIGPTTFLTLMTGAGGAAMSKGATEALGLTKEEAAKKKKEVEEELDIQELEAEMEKATPWTEETAAAWVESRNKLLEKHGITLKAGTVGDDGVLHVAAEQSKAISPKDKAWDEIDARLGTGAETDEATGEAIGEDDLGRQVKVLFVEKFEKKAEKAGVLGQVLGEDEPVKPAAKKEEAAVPEKKPVERIEAALQAAGRDVATAPELAKLVESGQYTMEEVMTRIAKKPAAAAKAEEPAAIVAEKPAAATTATAAATTEEKPYKYLKPGSDEWIQYWKGHAKEREEMLAWAKEVRAGTEKVLGPGKPAAAATATPAAAITDETMSPPSAEVGPPTEAELTVLYDKVDTRREQLQKEKKTPAEMEEDADLQRAQKDLTRALLRLPPTKAEEAITEATTRAAEGKQDMELKKAEKEAFDTAFKAKDEKALAAVLQRRYGKYAGPDELADMARAMVDEDYRNQLTVWGTEEAGERRDEEAYRATARAQVDTSNLRKATKEAQRADQKLQEGTVMGRPVERKYQHWGSKAAFDRWNELRMVSGIKVANDALELIKEQVAKENVVKAETAKEKKKAEPAKPKKVSEKPPTAEVFYKSLVGKTKDEVYAAMKEKSFTTKRVRELAKYMGITGYAKGKRDDLVRKIAMAGFTEAGPVQKEAKAKGRNKVLEEIVGPDQVAEVKAGTTPEPVEVEEPAVEEYAGVTDAEANQMNENIRDRARAVEIMRQHTGGPMTMLEALEQAKAERLSGEKKIYEEYAEVPTEVTSLQQRFSQAMVRGNVSMTGKISYNDMMINPEDWAVAQKIRAAERNIEDRKARITALEGLVRKKQGTDAGELAKYGYGKFQWKTAQEGIQQLGDMVRNAEQYIADLKTANEYWKSQQPKEEGTRPAVARAPYVETRGILGGREAADLEAQGRLQLDFDKVEKEVVNPFTKKTTKKTVYEFLGRKWGKDPNVYLVAEAGPYQGRFMRMLTPGEWLVTKEAEKEKRKTVGEKKAKIAAPVTLGDMELTSARGGPTIRLMPFAAVENELIPVFNKAIINPKTGRPEVAAKGNLRGTSNADVIETSMTAGDEEQLIGSRKFLRYPEPGVVRTVVIKDAKGVLVRDDSGRLDDPQGVTGAQALSGRMPPGSTVYVMDKFPKGKGIPMIWIYRVGRGELARHPGIRTEVRPEQLRTEPTIADIGRTAKEVKVGKELTPVPKGMKVQHIPMHEVGMTAEERYDKAAWEAEERVLTVIGLEEQHTVESVGTLLKQIYGEMAIIEPALRADEKAESLGIKEDQLDPETKRRYRRYAKRYTHAINYLENRLDKLQGKTPRHGVLSAMNRLLQPDVSNVPVYIRIPAEGLRKGLRAKYPRGTDTEQLMNSGDRFAITKPGGVVDVRKTAKFNRVAGVWQAVESRRDLDLRSPEGRAEWEALEGLDLAWVERNPALARQVFANNAVQTIFRKVGVADEEGEGGGELAAEGYAEGGPEAAQEQVVPGAGGPGRGAAVAAGAQGVRAGQQAVQTGKQVLERAGFRAVERARAYGLDAAGQRGGAHFLGRETFEGESQVQIDGAMRNTPQGFQMFVRTMPNESGGEGLVILYASDDLLDGVDPRDVETLSRVAACTYFGEVVVIGRNPLGMTSNTLVHEGVHVAHRHGHIKENTIKKIEAQAVAIGRAAISKARAIVRAGNRGDKTLEAAQYLLQRVDDVVSGNGRWERQGIISNRAPLLVSAFDLQTPEGQRGFEVKYDHMVWQNEDMALRMAELFRRAGTVIDLSDPAIAHVTMMNYLHMALAAESKMEASSIVPGGAGTLQYEVLATHISNSPVLADRLFRNIVAEYQSKKTGSAITGPQIAPQDLQDLPQTTGPPGQPTTNVAQPATNPGMIMRIRAMEMPELVRFIKEMMGGSLDKLRLRPSLVTAYGERGRFNTKTGKLELSRDIFQSEQEAAATIGSQIGRIVDWMDDHLPGPARGNILGRVAKLKKFMKQHYQALASNSEMREELKQVSQTQIPFNEDEVEPAYRRHRYSSKELYSDAISMLVNDPVLLQKLAPKFYSGFFEYLHKMPRVMNIYNNIQADLIDQAKLNRGRLELIRKGFQEVREKFDREVEEDKISQKAWWRTRAQDFYFHFIDKNQRTLTAIKGLRKMGITLDPERDPTYWLSEAPYVDNLIARYQYHVNDEIVKTLIEKKIDKDDFDTYLKLGRVPEYQVKGQAFPGGYTVSTAGPAYIALKNRVGIEKFNEMGRLQNLLFELRQKYVVPYVEKSEILSDENLRLMKTNKYYVTFLDEKFVNDLFTDQGIFKGMRPQVYQTTGNLNDKLLSPFIATVLKDAALIRATHQKMAVKTTVAALRAFWGDQEVKDAKHVQGGMLEHAPSGFETIIMMHKGKIKGFHVRPEVARQFKNDPYMAHHIAKTAMFISNISKGIFVRYNPVWIIRNLPRDIVDSYKKMRGFTLPAIIKEMIQSRGLAWDYVFKDLWNSDVDEMMAGKMLVAGRAFDPTRDTADAAISRMKQMQYMYGKDLQQADKHRKKFYENWLAPIDKFGQFTEAWTKIASYRLSKKYVDKLKAEKDSLEAIATRTDRQNKRLKWVKEEFEWVASPKKMAYDIRNRAGTPDIYRRGNWAWLYNSIFMFSNVGKEGWREHWSTLTDEYRIHGTKNLFESEYVWKTIKTTILPKMLMLMAGFGLLGDYWKKFFDNISEYNKSVNLIIPTGMTDKGESTYLRIAPDYGAQMIGSVFYRMVNLLYEQLHSDKFKYNPTEWSNFFDFVLDTNPYGSVHPLLGLLYETSELLRGANPYDGFTSKPIVPEYIMKTGNKWLIAQTFAGYAAEKMGARILGKNPAGLFTFRSETVPYQRKELYTELTEKVPILGPMAWTYWQVSDYGKRQRYEWVSTRAENAEMLRSHNRRQAIWKSLEPYADEGKKPSMTVANKLYRELVKEGTVDKRQTSWENFKNMYSRYALRMENNREVDMIVFARGNREKAELLYEYQRVLSPEEYSRVVYHLRREGMLTSETMAALKRLKGQREKERR